MEKLLPCQICGHKYIDDSDGYGSYDICPICGWEDEDWPEFIEDNHGGGANYIGYHEARKAFKQGGGAAVRALKKAAREKG